VNEELPKTGGAKEGTTQAGGKGDDSPTAAGDASLAAKPHTRVNPLAVAKRLQTRPDWSEIAKERNWRIKEARADGLLRPEAQQRAYEELDRRYPETPPETPPDAAESGVAGLGDLPPDWPDLPANASLAAEIQWVQASRLDVVEELPGGAVRVHLARADRPAPSKAAIGWLETSIRAYAKYCDIAAKATAHQEDEKEAVRREKLATDDMHALLASMVTPPAT